MKKGVLFGLAAVAFGVVVYSLNKKGKLTIHTYLKSHSLFSEWLFCLYIFDAILIIARNNLSLQTYFIAHEEHS
jgi:uncharacterized membrane protein YdjX (TVP38/TMEM64 family)